MSLPGDANVAPEERLFHITALFWKIPSLIIHDCQLLRLYALFLSAVEWGEIP